MNKFIIIMLSVYISMITACSTAPSSSGNTTSKTTEFNRAYARLSQEDRSLIEKHISYSELESMANSHQTVTDILEHAKELERIEVSTRHKKEKAEKNNDLHKNKVDCNFFDITDLIPSRQKILKLPNKVNKARKILELRKQGLCK